MRLDSTRLKKPGLGMSRVECCRTLIAALAVLTGTAAGADEPAEVPRKPAITALAFSPDGRELVTGSQAGIEVRSWPELSVVRRVETKLRQVHDVAFSPDGRLVALAGGEPAVHGAVEVLAWPSCALEYRVEQHADVVYDVAWHPDGTSWAGASLDRSVSHCRAADGNVLRRIEGHARGVLAVCFTDEGRLLVTAGLDNSLRVWDASSGALLRTLDNHTQPVHGLAVRPGQAQEALPVIASAAADRSVRLWQPTIGRMMRFARFEQAFPLAVCWSPDGTRLLAACSDGRLRVVDPDTVEVTATFEVIAGRAYCVAVHPHGKAAVVGGENGEVRAVELR